MFFRATIRRLFPVACAAVMICASTVAHVPRAPVPRIPLQVAQPALAGHWPPNLVTDTGIAVTPATAPLRPTLNNPLVIRGDTDQRVTLTSNLVVSGIENVHIQGLVIYSTNAAPALVFQQAEGAVLASCLVQARAIFDACTNLCLGNNTFDSTQAVNAVYLTGCSNILVRNNIFLNDGVNSGISTSTCLTVDSGYNLYWPAAGPAGEIGSINSDQLLDAFRWITSKLSLAVNSGVPLAACPADLRGWYHHKTTPGMGAVAFETEVNTVDAAGRIEKRVVAGREYQYAYDARGQLTSYTDVDNPANSGTYAYDFYRGKGDRETTRAVLPQALEGDRETAPTK